MKSNACSYAFNNDDNNSKKVKVKCILGFMTLH